MTAEEKKFLDLVSERESIFCKEKPFENSGSFYRRPCISNL